VHRTRQPAGAYSYQARSFWLYLQSQNRLRNVALVGVLYAYNGNMTMAPVAFISAAKKTRATIRMVIAMNME
jgi:hypothetical protein